MAPGTGHGMTPEKADLTLSRIRHRGPDALGTFVDNQVWLGHVRLSLLDLSEAANQPMATADGRHVICFNGEVYNFSDIARSLDLRGLRTHSDTEVVLRAFAERGIESIKLLNGMFAFALFDMQRRKFWLVRDRLGIKPLYYRLSRGELAFASEIKGLPTLDDGSAACEMSAVHEWLYYGASLGERTLHQGIKKLLPGHYLELDLQTLDSRIECYWSPSQYAECVKHAGSVDERIKETRVLLEQAVRRQLVSDVPVGVFLSGGIDSSAITAFASRHYGGKLATYSVGFDFDNGVNELPKARSLAERHGTDHHEIHISGIGVADVVERMVDHHDLPFCDAANIPLFLLSSRIKGITKVVLQGDGGDEMFGGYSRYTTLSFFRLARALAGAVSLVNKLTNRNPAYHRRQRYLNALLSGAPAEVMALLLTEEDRDAKPDNVFSQEVREQVLKADPFRRYRECQGRFESEDIVNQMLLVDAMIILPDIFLEKVDRATMAASVEVRVPFLDHDLVDHCFRMSGPQKVRLGRRKWLLKKALDGVVPAEILHGRKTGFGVPYGYWLRSALKPLFFDQLDTFQNRHPGVLDGAVIHSLHDEHSTRRRDRSFLLWTPDCRVSPHYPVKLREGMNGLQNQLARLNPGLVGSIPTRSRHRLSRPSWRRFRGSSLVHGRASRCLARGQAAVAVGLEGRALRLRSIES